MKHITLDVRNNFNKYAKLWNAMPAREYMSYNNKYEKQYTQYKVYNTFGLYVKQLL